MLIGYIKVLGVGFGDFHHHEVILEHLLVVCDEALRKRNLPCDINSCHLPQSHGYGVIEIGWNFLSSQDDLKGLISINLHQGGNVVLHGVHKEKDVKKTTIVLIKIEVNVISVSNFAVFLQSDVIVLIFNNPVIGLAGYTI